VRGVGQAEREAGEQHDPEARRHPGSVRWRGHSSHPCFVSTPVSCG
jgi:hypothetical protein